MLGSFSDFLEREAGHIVMSLLLVLIGAALLKLGINEGRDLIVFSMGVLSRSMGNNQQSQPLSIIGK
jgi:hypothetical protein